MMSMVRLIAVLVPNYTIIFWRRHF